ncbi:hypothetical protein [Streptomyces sp. NPDC048643]|uniref:hypothetical protein n=1 Tax=Streptomyces sp. NPDC048643 TaxID=3155637 RepID=UPI003443280B
MYAIYPELRQTSNSLDSGYNSYPWVPGLWATDFGYQPLYVWVAILCLLLMTFIAAAQRAQTARMLARELSAAYFSGAASDPAERALSIRFQRLRQHIRAEQHSPLVLYNAAAPFRGAGVPYPAWTHAVTIRSRLEQGYETRKPELHNEDVLRCIVARLEQMRIPSAHGSTQAGAVVRDRLRQLSIDECVFLPVDGLPSRAQAPQTRAEFEAHRVSAVEESGDRRRHFVRVQVSGWDGGLVATVYIRVHTQGGLLTLEVAPYVLRPVRSAFQSADRIAHRQRQAGIVAKVAQAIVHVPEAAGCAPLVLWRGVKVVWRLLIGGRASLPEGPALSVRELASDRITSAFQDMDVQRYLKSVRESIANGVVDALREAGCQVDDSALATGIFVGPVGQQQELSALRHAGGGAA